MKSGDAAGTSSACFDALEGGLFSANPLVEMWQRAVDASELAGVFTAMAQDILTHSSTLTADLLCLAALRPGVTLATIYKVAAGFADMPLSPRVAQHRIRPELLDFIITRISTQWTWVYRLLHRGFEVQLREDAIKEFGIVLPPDFLFVNLHPIAEDEARLLGCQHETRVVQHKIQELELKRRTETEDMLAACHAENVALRSENAALHARYEKEAELRHAAATILVERLASLRAEVDASKAAPLAYGGVQADDIYKDEDFMTVSSTNSGLAAARTPYLIERLTPFYADVDESTVNSIVDFYCSLLEEYEEETHVSAQDSEDFQDRVLHGFRALRKLGPAFFIVNHLAGLQPDAFMPDFEAGIQCIVQLNKLHKQLEPYGKKTLVQAVRELIELRDCMHMETESESELQTTRMQETFATRMKACVASRIGGIKDRKA